ncbi:MAG: helix-turn-helix domain-containing protein [Saccharofermentanales bacterium]
MKIKTVDIKYFSTASLNAQNDGLKHIKSLPYLSVVQATEGFYEIGIGSDNQVKIDEMGAFIAPTYEMQYITHHVNPRTGNMTAHWLFLDVIINNQFRLDEIFNFPVEIPGKFNSAINEIIYNVATLDSICLQLSEIYKLIQILIDIGMPQESPNSRIRVITSFIHNHLAEKIDIDLLANELHVSVPTLYRIFNENFQMSPANYLNSIRLMQAVSLLETTDESISSISEKLGFYDFSYFSRLFKKRYKVSPFKYRKTIEFMSQKN